MYVTVRTFATLRELSTDRCDLAVADDAVMTDAWAAFQLLFPRIEPHRPYVRAARNGTYAGWDEPLAEADMVAFLPPVSGGASGGLSDQPIDVAAVEAALAGPEHGAVVTFVGRARNVADDGRTVTELEYEVFPEMAESVLAEITAEVRARFGVAVSVVHRFGIVPIGEAAVVIVTAARHRAEAYESNRFVIEAIKARLPIWKRECFADGTEWKRSGA